LKNLLHSATEDDTMMVVVIRVVPKYKFRITVFDPAPFYI